MSRRRIGRRAKVRLGGCFRSLLLSGRRLDYYAATECSPPPRNGGRLSGTGRVSGAARDTDHLVARCLPHTDVDSKKEFHIMSLPLSDVAQLVGGKLSGDGAIAIHGAAILRDARRGDVTLIDKPRLLKQLATCEASAILCPSGLEIDGRPSVAVDDVHACFARIVEHFRPQPAATGCGISPQAVISSTAVLGPDVVVHPARPLARM